MRALLTLALKDLRVLSRDRMALFWALGFPVLFALFFGSIMKAGAELDTPSVRVALVSEGPTAPDYLVRLEEALRAAGLSVSRHDRQDAERAVQHGDAALSIEVPEPASWQAVRIGVDPARRSEASYAAAVLRAVLTSALSKEPPALPPFDRGLAGSPDSRSASNLLRYQSRAAVQRFVYRADFCVSGSLPVGVAEQR